ncbi:YqgQ family protein [Lactococcus formosensis]|uniref:YqgQ family protein n=1 Tax=Lactococcus formosensis TaxID=1281486 RepID=A0A9X4PKX3_9LACT|nr:YqgQ family protein [Lactococcus formosensis]MDG6143306.1 YqgQ family protein [Lactococcus formosensis]MDG6155687.1 YqgQ family protein [Lactococcus formosensis]MDG6160604.1 YqgQ family protein [Lactococcus formosensis]MDG6166852.1 YqgQ family protein [Lactococcus formosensis]MDG6173188.1 YqgQ family protein [Lactococcus formosensis]
MKTLYDVQELLKKYGFINFMTNRLDAIYFMQQELTNMVEQGIFEKSDKEYLAAQLILRREERIEKEKLNG